MIIGFESETVEGIIREFRNAVDDYLEFCAEMSKAPALEEASVAYA